MTPLNLTKCFLIVAFSKVFLSGLALSVPIDLSTGTTAQSTQLDNFVASNAIDGVNNFTHTLSDDPDPTWQVLLPTARTFEEITLVNRGGGGSWLQRFRDLTVQVIDFGGNVNNDFDGGTVVYSSPLLNPNNVLNSPTSIVVSVGGATGNMIRVIRTPGNAQGNDAVLSLNEVFATAPERVLSFSASPAIVTPGDPIELNWEVSSGVTDVAIDNGVGDVSGHTSSGLGSVVVNTGPSASTTYEITADDASGASTAFTTVTVVNDPLIYSFAADNGFISLGDSANLTWNVGGNVTSLTLNGSNVLGSSGITVSPSANTSYVLEASNANGTITRTLAVRIIEPGVPVINEFLASNDEGIVDEDGVSSDWIELFNPGPDPAPLAGYFLTDDAGDLQQWAFPNVTMAPGSYLIVYASSNDRTDPSAPLHTNFSLTSGGEYLALIKPDGVTPVSEFSPMFPEQYTDVSYGYDPFSSSLGYFLTPTPGAANGSTVAGFVEDTSFSVDRGFYSSPFQVAITSQTPGAEIRYTLDGSKPTAITGLVYSSPISINSTTVLRAAAYKDEYEPTNVDTHTYIFKSDVIASAHMDTGITQDSTYGPQMDASLSAIPSISLNFDNDLGYDEQEVSIEMINFEVADKQVDAGLERFGGYNTNFAKRSARINFRKQYGPGRLDFDLFENHDWLSYQPAEKYDAIELRAGNHDMSQRGAYLSNRYVDDALLDMGQIAPHGRFVHVYMNGEYWGQYHLRERWNGSMLSEYFGGDKEEYEAINANDGFQQDLRAYDGTGEFWAETEVLAAGPNPFTNARTHVDIIDEIDFMLLYVSGRCESEFRSAGSKTQEVPFKFFIKDGDGYLRSPTHNVNDDGPLDLMEELRNEGDPDYAILLADRIHRHFFNDGALSSSMSIQRLQERVDETELSIISECARWGYRSPSSWVSFQDNLLNNQLPAQESLMIQRFKDGGMYPDLAAPVYSQHGGHVMGVGPTVSVTDDSLQVYYMYGSRDSDPDPYRHSLDPRLPGGEINAAAFVVNFNGTGGVPVNFVVSGDTWSFLDNGSNQGIAWRAKNFVENAAWQNGLSELGYGDGDEATVVGYVDVNPAAAGDQKNVTTYFRKSDINIPNPSLFADFTLNYTYDDAIAIYVNGVEVDRENLTANAPYDEFSSGTVGDNAFGTLQIPTSYFDSGNNTIAAEIHQRSHTSSDISFDLTLVGNLPGGGISGTTSDPIPITTSGWLLSRTYNSSTGEWSALNEAFFTPEPIAADASNLVISEFNYNPYHPTSGAELSITTDADDFEFVELKNVALQPVDLSGVSFIDGINFTFGPNNIIPAGGRMIIVKNQVAFAERYFGALDGVLFGTDSTGLSEFGGKLSNGGEQIILVDASGGIIHDFTYDDTLPWPTSSDGPGFSLALIAPNLPIPDHNIGSNWAASAQYAGSPGLEGGVGFGGSDPHANEDGDGFNALIEYALGSSDHVRNDETLMVLVDDYLVNGSLDDYLTISYVQNQHSLNSVTIEPQISIDLQNWDSIPDLVLVSETVNSDGNFSFVYRSSIPYGERPSGREFIRVRVSEK